VIKVINMVALLFAPIFVKYNGTNAGMLTVVIICLLIIAGAIIFSKRGGFFKRAEVEDGDINF